MHALDRKQLLWLAGLLLLWSLYGLTGHDAWKPYEARVLGGLLDWQAQGALFQEASPPLYSLAVSLVATFSGGALELQDAARVATGLFSLLAFLCTGLAARALFGPGHEAAAVLSLMGCLGLMLRAHALLPETATLLAYALLLLALVEARERALRGGLLLAAAFACLALLRGWADLAAGLVIVLATLLSWEWRRPPLLRALLLGLALSGLLLAGLSWQAAGQGSGWLGMSGAFLVRPRHPGSVLEDLSWIAWPVWPLALWSIWYDARRLRREFVLHPLLLAVVILYAWAHVQAYSREGGLVALLVPLSLLAARALPSLKRGAAQAMYWFGVLTFSFFAIAFWFYYLALDWGWPVRAAAHLARLTPQYTPGAIGPAAWFVAGAATLLWLVAIPLFPRAKVRPVLVWATGMTVTWVTLYSLFHAWGDAGWGYRATLRDMVRHLPAQACLRVAGQDDVAAMARYYLPERYRAEGTCDYWLVAGRPTALRLDGHPMQHLWTGARPRAKQDVFSLYAVARN